jgi:hypothetical protein
MAAQLKQIACGRPSELAIELLTEALEAAKSGELLSVAIAWCDRNELTHTNYSNDSNLSGRRDLVAAVGLLNHRLVKAWNDG